MAQKILTKGGAVANIADAILDRRELALAYGENGKVQLWVGTGENEGKGKVLLNPDVTVPAKVSDLTNDSGFQTAEQVATIVQTAIAETGHASFKEVNAVPSVEDAEDNILYLVKNTETGHFDVYAKIGDKMEWLDDITIDLSDYAKTADVVAKEDGMGLSKNNYDDTAKAAVDGLPAALASKVGTSDTIDGGTF